MRPIDRRGGKLRQPYTRSSGGRWPLVDPSIAGAGRRAGAAAALLTLAARAPLGNAAGEEEARCVRSLAHGAVAARLESLPCQREEARIARQAAAVAAGQALGSRAAGERGIAAERRALSAAGRSKGDCDR